MARPLWKGAISFGLVSIPVSLYPAKNARETISLHMLHAADLRRIHNRWFDDAGHEVSYEEIVKGYEYEKDRYVVLERSDIEGASVKATQTIDIMHFVDSSEIDVAYYETPYYTEPSKIARRAYTLLRETLKQTGKVGVAKIVIRERQHLCAVLPEGPTLLACTLRWPYQLREATELDVPSDGTDSLELTPEELKMAEQLVAAMTTPWDPTRYQDTFHETLLALIEERARKGEVTAPAASPVATADARQATGASGGEVVDIMSLLKKSVQQQKSRKRA